MLALKRIQNCNFNANGQSLDMSFDKKEDNNKNLPDIEIAIVLTPFDAII